jgi:hypothetical protein
VEKGKIIITGTGRAGTSLLVALFTKLGLDTGFNDKDVDNIQQNKEKAGLESLIYAENHIIKSPQLAGVMDGVCKNIKVDHVIIPMRELKHTAASRERLGNGMNGGFTEGVSNLEEQMNWNSKITYQLMFDMCKNEIPFTLIEFPKFARKPDYLWNKLNWLFGMYGVDKIKFDRISKEVINLNFINF